MASKSQSKSSLFLVLKDFSLSSQIASLKILACYCKCARNFQILWLLRSLFARVPNPTLLNYSKFLLYFLLAVKHYTEKNHRIQHRLLLHNKFHEKRVCLDRAETINACAKIHNFKPPPPPYLPPTDPEIRQHLIPGEGGGGNYHIYIYAGTGCAIFWGAFFRAENKFWGIIFGKITSIHKFWGVILEK